MRQWDTIEGGTVRRAQNVTADGGCTNNKMADGGIPPAPLALPGDALRRQAGPRTKGLFCQKENVHVPCQFFPNV